MYYKKAPLVIFGHGTRGAFLLTRAFLSGIPLIRWLSLIIAVPRGAGTIEAEAIRVLQDTIWVSGPNQTKN